MGAGRKMLLERIPNLVYEFTRANHHKARYLVMSETTKKSLQAEIKAWLPMISDPEVPGPSRIYDLIIATHDGDKPDMEVA